MVCVDKGLIDMRKYTTINSDSMIRDRAAYHVCVWDINHPTEMICIYIHNNLHTVHYSICGENGDALSKMIHLDTMHICNLFCMEGHHRRG